MKLLIVLFLFLSLSACLQTREEIKTSEEREVLQQQVGHLQKQKADDQARLDEFESILRELHGRIEVIEKNSQDLIKEKEVDRLAQENYINEKLTAYEQALKSLDEQLVKMNHQIIELRAQLSANKSKAAKAKVPQGNFKSAEYYFSSKKWDKAIENYEKYRKLNPKGRRFAQATYKIGLSFQELGMDKEAQVFYKEVISKYPKSSEAKKSKTRLSKIK